MTPEQPNATSSRMHNRRRPHPRAALVDVQLECAAGELRTSQRRVPYLVLHGFSVCYFRRKGTYKIWRMADRGTPIGEVDTPTEVRDFLSSHGAQLPKSIT